MKAEDLKKALKSIQENENIVNVTKKALVIGLLTCSLQGVLAQNSELAFLVDDQIQSNEIGNEGTWGNWTNWSNSSGSSFMQWPNG